jgi:NAD+ kinase
MIPLIRSIGIFANTARPDARDAVLPVLEFLVASHRSVVVESGIADWLPPDAPLARAVAWAPREELASRVDLLVTFGGDGTMLAAAQYTLPCDTLILGINLGKLGFLADINASDTIAAIEDVLAGRCRIENRMTITGSVDGVPDVHALNDIVISKGGLARILQIEAAVDGEFLASFLADGIILATPTGSTAYSLATGGPIVVPSSDVMIVSPISAHTLTARPVIIPGSSTVTVFARAAEGSILLMSDGRITEHRSNEIALTVRRGKRSVRLVKQSAPTYFPMLRKKLSWAQDNRFTQNP